MKITLVTNNGRSLISDIMYIHLPVFTKILEAKNVQYSNWWPTNRARLEKKPQLCLEIKLMTDMCPIWLEKAKLKGIGGGVWLF